MSHSTKILLFTLLLTIFISKTIAVSQLISSVCNQSRNPNFCITALTLDPSHNSITELATLGEVSVASTRQAATITNNFIENALRSGSNPNGKQVLEQCKNYNNDAMLALDLAKGDLKLKNNRKFGHDAYVALANYNDCNRVNKQGPTVPGLVVRVTYMLNLVDITVTIADMLL